MRFVDGFAKKNSFWTKFCAESWMSGTENVPSSFLFMERLFALNGTGTRMRQSAGRNLNSGEKGFSKWCPMQRSIFLSRAVSDLSNG